MSKLLKFGAAAAFINSSAALAMLFVAFGLIGPAALVDQQKLTEMAVNNPAPLIFQDVLKFAAALCAVVLIFAIPRFLKTSAPALMSVAASFGFLAFFSLVASAALDLYLIRRAGKTPGLPAEAVSQLNFAIMFLGMAVIFFNGLWYLLVSWTALKPARFPKALCYLGFAMGLLSLFPPFGIFVLVLGIGWSIWVGKVLLKNGSV